MVAIDGCISYNSGMTWDIYGHDGAIALLKEHTKPEKLRHAYLLTGPQGVGRRSLALAFIKALNCLQPVEQGVPCGVCDACQQIERQTFPDLAFLVPEDGHKDIRIEQVRALLHTLVLAPYQATYRVALILDFQRITLGAANALLKTLEEPPPKAIMILTADAQESLLPTIASRCEVIRLRPMPVEAAQQVLIESKGLNPMDARLLAHITSGRLGAAMRLYGDSQSLAARGQVLKDLRDLLPASRRERFGYVEGQLRRNRSGRDDLFEIISIWLTFWRDVFICTAGADMPLVNIDQELLIRKVAQQVNLETAQNIMASLEEGLKQLDMYINARLLAENLLLMWPRLGIADR